MDETLISLVKKIGLTALDVGARGGGNEDLQGIAAAVDYVGFEPDAEECARLNAMPGSGGWASSRHLPVALAAEAGAFDLNLYSKRGCSSKLTAIKAVGEIFCHGDYYDCDTTVKVPCARLDDLVGPEQICEPASMKIDVQGMEIEVFDGATVTLREHLCAVRTEVSFLPLYEDQPLFAEVDQRLRRDGFVPMRWLESHDWRRQTPRKARSYKKGEMPYSRGQLVHADVLYMQQPETLSVATPAALRRLLRLGVLAVCYEHYDHALAAFALPAVRHFCREELGLDPEASVRRLSKVKATWSRKLAWKLMRELEKRYA